MLPATFEPIPPLDPEQPLRALSLPAWLQFCLKSLSPDYSNPTLPAELALADPQRAAIAARADALAEAEMASDRDLTMAVVVDLLEGFPTAKLTDDQAKRKAKAYLTALESMPTWSVAEAARRWLQAKAGAQNYDFAPTPPRLREIADDVMAEVRGQRVTLQRLLRVKSASHEKTDPEMRQRINAGYAELLAQLKTRVRLDVSF